jgi:hypothetical protein
MTPLAPSSAKGSAIFYEEVLVTPLAGPLFCEHPRSVCATVESSWLRQVSS